MFLMATSAIGPGFLTQTTTFTVQLGAAFAFVILVPIIVDIAIQLNVWRIIGISGRRAQDLANHALPGAGFLLAALDVFGGLVFNIGNIAGTLARAGRAVRPRRPDRRRHLRRRRDRGSSWSGAPASRWTGS